MMSLIRVFDKFGFLVQMIIFCVKALIPFSAFYLLVLIVFTVGMIIAGMDLYSDSLAGGA